MMVFDVSRMVSDVSQISPTNFDPATLTPGELVLQKCRGHTHNHHIFEQFSSSDSIMIFLIFKLKNKI